MSKKLESPASEVVEPTQGEIPPRRRMRGPTHRLCISVNVELLEECEAEAQRRGMSLTSFFSNAAREYLDKRKLERQTE